jgi:hypothetical protein
MEAGQTYQIDMKALDKSIDPYLCLEDPDGKVVAEDDDGGGNLDARIIHKATKSGKYRVIATGLGPGVGRFKITIRRLETGQSGNAKEPGIPADKKEGVTAETPPKLPNQANGLIQATGGAVIDLAQKPIMFGLGPTFDITKSWFLTFECSLADLKNPMGMLLFWGDDRPGLDPIFVRQRGTILEAAVSDCRKNTSHGINADMKDVGAGKWAKVLFCYKAPSQEIELWLDDRLVRREKCSVSPYADRPMPIWLGGVNATNQRFTGKLKNIRLGN